MKVVVFGGSGFVGSHLADAFSEAGHDVRIFDVKPSPYLREDQEMVVGDLLNLDEVLVAVQGFDVVCNFAGIADLDDARTRPADTVYQNVLGTVHVLEAARLAEVRRYMHASTVYVYSDRGGSTAAASRRLSSTSRSTRNIMAWTLPFCGLAPFSVRGRMSGTAYGNT